jgi:hypothetical protein
MKKRGPNTDRGKAVVRRNAWKHGIRSEVMAIDTFEEVRDWETHQDGIVEDCKPEGHLENSLVERIAIALWKLRRLEQHQATLTLRYIGMAYGDVQIGQAYAQGTIAKGIFPDVSAEDLFKAQAVRTFPSPDEMALVIRYETHYHRLLIQTLHELEAMQTRRQGGASPLARLDITGTPG